MSKEKIILSQHDVYSLWHDCKIWYTGLAYGSTDDHFKLRSSNCSVSCNNYEREVHVYIEGTQNEKQAKFVTLLYNRIKGKMKLFVSTRVWHEYYEEDVVTTNEFESLRESLCGKLDFIKTLKPGDRVEVKADNDFYGIKAGELGTILPQYGTCPRVRLDGRHDDNYFDRFELKLIQEEGLK